MTMTGAERIAAERQRQILEEGYSAERDAAYQNDELAFAACYYAVPHALEFSQESHTMSVRPNDLFALTGWNAKYAKRPRHNRIRQLAIAGALIAAEIDRLTALDGGRACRVCGCTEHCACVSESGEACHWVEHDLCSVCVEKTR